MLKDILKELWSITMKDLRLFYQIKNTYEFNLARVSQPISWYRSEQNQNPDYWDNEIFIADVNFIRDI